MADAEHPGDPAVPGGLGKHALLGVHENDGEIGRRGAGGHVAGVLLVARSVRHEERAARRFEAAVGDVDRDSLLALGLEAVHEKGQVGTVALSAVAAGGALNGLQLVFEDSPALAEQAADERALAVVHAAAHHETERGEHQKYPSRFLRSMDASPSWSIRRPRRSDWSAASVSARIPSTVSASLSTPAVSG